jgi:hypothetical protein
VLSVENRWRCQWSIDHSHYPTIQPQFIDLFSHGLALAASKQHWHTVMCWPGALPVVYSWTMFHYHSVPGCIWMLQRLSPNEYPTTVLHSFGLNWGLLRHRQAERGITRSQLHCGTRRHNTAVWCPWNSKGHTDNVNEKEGESFITALSIILIVT